MLVGRSESQQGQFKVPRRVVVDIVGMFATLLGAIGTSVDTESPHYGKELKPVNTEDVAVADAAAEDAAAELKDADADGERESGGQVDTQPLKNLKKPTARYGRHPRAHTAVPHDSHPATCTYDSHPV